MGIEAATRFVTFVKAPQATCETVMQMRAERRALDKLYKRRDRYEIPDWQRQEVWSTDKKRKLIDSILRGWKLPKFYFQKTQDNPDEFDGQQRLSAIWEFFDDELSLSAKMAAEFGGATYAELPEEVSDRFDDYEIEYDEITEATDEEVKDFFQRLQEGLPLTSSEKLNSVHSKLRDFCTRAATDSFFAERTYLSNKRYAFFDITAKVMAIEIEGLDAGFRYDDLRQLFTDNRTFSPRAAAAKRVSAALEYLRQAFPERSRAFRNRSVVQSVLTLVCHLQQAGLQSKQESLVRGFVEFFVAELNRQVELGQKATDSDFVEFQRTVNANVKSGARTRQVILLRKLFRAHPTFFNSLSHSEKLEAGVHEGLSRLGRAIQDLTTTINERWAAQHGNDLFKPTNRTVKALVSVSRPVSDLSQYKTFIEELYFVFREGVGQRLDGRLPSSFVDVNDLRTLLQHDVDHGKRNRVATKRKKLAATFTKYAGVTSPDAMDPAALPIVQTNILAALEADLSGLARSLA